MFFEKNLRKLREDKGLSQLQLSKEIGLSNVTLSQYESGVRKPDIVTLQMIAKYFNVTTDHLLGNETSLTEKDEKDIAKSMERLKDQLKNSQGLMFDGEPLDEETKSLLLEELERQERLVKTINKKYIPKKFRK